MAATRLYRAIPEPKAFTVTSQGSAVCSDPEGGSGARGSDGGRPGLAGEARLARRMAEHALVHRELAACDARPCEPRRLSAPPPRRPRVRAAGRGAPGW